jgi:3-hydroxyacyl-[acyl-carrier-protein] dehydratase
MLVGVNNVRFKRIVEPGDQLEIYAEVVTVKRGIWKFSCNAKVDGELVTSAEILCTQKKADK